MLSSHEEYFELNRQAWDQRAPVHLDSAFYDLTGFKNGNTALREIELGELTEVADKDLLHLQCHFGMDTLSWARLGARCTGVDFSAVAIDQARNLAKEMNISAEFICANVYDFKNETPEAFDIVFTSYGTICWLPDLEQWAQVIAENLRPGGIFYIVDFHPIFDLVSGYDYFPKTKPDVEEGGTYTENGDKVTGFMASWAHSLSSILNALINHGLTIQSVNEYPFSPYNCFAGLEEREPGRYYFAKGTCDVPMTYSIRAQKQ